MKLACITSCILCMATPKIGVALEKIINGQAHKYWVCDITSYRTNIDGTWQEKTCAANTQYSEPPCRDFYVDYEGENGIRPGHPLKQSHTENAMIADLAMTTRTSIEISEKQGKFLYSHSIEQTRYRFSAKWLYQGRCEYYEAPANETVYLDYGLKTGL